MPRAARQWAALLRALQRAAFTSVHIAVQSSRCLAVRFGVKLVRCSIVGSPTEKACLSVASVIALITSWFEEP
mgnify:CR=1 FL=1